MFQYRRTSQHVYNALDKGVLDLPSSYFYVPTPVDEFTYEVVSDPDASDSFTLTSDITMLFNQQRLDRCSKDSLLQYFESLGRSSSAFSELRSKLNDDQLMSIVKSRYIQSPSELLAYSERLVQEYGVEIAALSQHAAVEPSSGSDPDPAVE